MFATVASAQERFYASPAGAESSIQGLSPSVGALKVRVWFAPAAERYPAGAAETGQRIPDTATVSQVGRI